MTKGGRRRGPGRPQITDEPLERITVYIRASQKKWLKESRDAGKKIRAALDLYRRQISND